MCDICRAVEAGVPRGDAVAAYEANMMDTIKLYGWAITGVDDADPVYFYTLGRTLMGLPELMVTGLDPHRSVAMLTRAHEMGADLRPGRVADLIGPPEYQAAAIACDPERAGLLLAKRLFEPERTVTALQIIWPDRDNRLPNEDGYTSEFPQPIYLPQGN